MKTAFPAKRTAAVVQGPIKCHKCQAKCADAEAYLKHQCQSAASADEPYLRRLVMRHSVVG